MWKMCLQSSIVYGPVSSRRLGESLGINLLPTSFKLCTLNCVYCQYGFSNQRYFNSIPLEFFPRKLLVIREIEKSLLAYKRMNKTIDCITFAGNGEPTLYPHFAEIIDTTIRLRDKLMPHVKIAILSNSSTLTKPAIRDIIHKIDRKIMKLDAGNTPMFRKINQPHEKIRYLDIVHALQSLDSLMLQTLFVQGSINNSTDEHVDALIKVYKRIEPQSIQIYSLDREPADKTIKPVCSERLVEIKDRIEQTTSIPVDAF